MTLLNLKKVLNNFFYEKNIAGIDFDFVSIFVNQNQKRMVKCYEKNY